MKFVAIIDGKKKGPDRITSFIYADDGPVPLLVDPEKPEEAKDGGMPVGDNGPARKTAEALPIHQISKTVKKVERHRPRKGSNWR